MTNWRGSSTRVRDQPIRPVRRRPYHVRVTMAHFQITHFAANLCTELTKLPPPIYVENTGALMPPPQSRGGMIDSRMSNQSSLNASSTLSTLLECDRCAAQCSDEQALKNHSVLHQPSPKRIYECVQCHLFFSNHDRRERHIVARGCAAKGERCTFAIIGPRM